MRNKGMHRKVEVALIKDRTTKGHPKWFGNV